LAVLLRLLFDLLYKAGEPVVKLDLLLSLALLLLELIHVSESLALRLVIQIISRIACLFEELNILVLLLSNKNWHFQMEVNDHYQFIFSAGLEKGVLDI
jgi:hypothetical protein